MIPKEDELCSYAAGYFPDMLNPDTLNNVPDKVLLHIASCTKCSKKLFELQKSMAAFICQNREKEHLTEQAKEQLNRHFELIKSDVDCVKIKKFLPFIADPEINITIPTPVTTHIDQCSQCRHDVMNLRAMNLNSENLAKLAEIFARGSFRNSPECEDVRYSLEMIKDLYFDRVSGESLDHYFSCMECRDFVYNARRKFIYSDEYLETGESYICPIGENLTNDQLFTCCIPPDSWHGRRDLLLAEHIRNCVPCLRQLQSLHDTIFGVLDGANSGVVTYYEPAPLIDGPNLTGKLIDCQIARKILPDLAAEPQEAFIPSPAIRHIQQCPQCQKDLETIKSLRLNTRQLTRLRWMFCRSSDAKKVECEEARKYIDAMVMLDYDRIDRGVSIHLCTCPDCRKLIYQRRQELISQLSYEYRQVRDFPCDLLRDIDIFNYCFPYGINPKELYYHHFDHPAFEFHVSNCPKCLTKMQKLHQKIAAIDNRENSGILTNDNPPLSAKKFGYEQEVALYGKWPIKVWVKRNQCEIFRPLSELANDAGYKRVVRGHRVEYRKIKSKLRTIAIPAGAAAAVIAVIAGLFFFLLQPAGIFAHNIKLENFFNTTKNVKNICIKNFKANEKEPYQTIWLSQTFNTSIKKFRENMSYVDVEKKVGWSKNLNTGKISRNDFGGEALESFRKQIFAQGSLVPFPFESISELPVDSQWVRIPNNEAKNPIEGTEVYELILPLFVKGRQIIERWRYHIDSKTLLPKRFEFCEKTTFERGFSGVGLRREFEYPTDSEIKAVIEEHFQ